jgi:predicted esterase
MTVNNGTVEESESPNITNLERGMCALSFQQPSSNQTPVFIAHSRDDPLVPFNHGEGLQKTIRNLGFDVTWKDYEDGAHWIHPKLGVDDMSTFLRKIV